MLRSHTAHGHPRPSLAPRRRLQMRQKQWMRRRQRRRWQSRQRQRAARRALVGGTGAGGALGEWKRRCGGPPVPCWAATLDTALGVGKKCPPRDLIALLPALCLLLANRAPAAGGRHPAAATPPACPAAEREARARRVYERAFRGLRDSQPDAKEEAVMLLESWRAFESSCTSRWVWGWHGGCGRGRGGARGRLGWGAD